MGVSSEEGIAQSYQGSVLLYVGVPYCIVGCFCFDGSVDSSQIIGLCKGEDVSKFHFHWPRVLLKY